MEIEKITDEQEFDQMTKELGKVKWYQYHILCVERDDSVDIVRGVKAWIYVGIAKYDNVRLRIREQMDPNCPVRAEFFKNPNIKPIGVLSVRSMGAPSEYKYANGQETGGAYWLKEMLKPLNINVYGK